MNKPCPYCFRANHKSDSRPVIIKAGHFRRKSDSRFIQRFRCLECKRYFSNSTENPAFGQKKRRINTPLEKLLWSGVSIRRASFLLRSSRTTIARKVEYLGVEAKLHLKKQNLKHPPISEVQFDDQETFEHTKCKPLSVTLAVDSRTRRILGFEISQMPANGHLAKISVKKYGKRKDERRIGRRKLFEKIKPYVQSTALFKSDENPHYPMELKLVFPHATHKTFKGKRGSVVGEGELKKVRFDPLFSLNHTCAMGRYNINRLRRRTWCSTKSPARLADHYAIHAKWHNKTLKPPKATAP